MDKPEKLTAKTHYKLCWTPLCVNKTCALVQTTGGKAEPNIVFIWKS